MADPLFYGVSLAHRPDIKIIAENIRRHSCQKYFTVDIIGSNSSLEEICVRQVISLGAPIGTIS